MTRLSSVPIGYVGYSPTWQAAGDRRRLIAYARQRSLMVERAETSGHHEIVVVAQNGNLSGWTAAKHRRGSGLKLVLDLTDPYFAQNSRIQRFIMAAGRYAEGRESRLSVDFRKVLERACRAADAVICSTPEQREMLLPYNSNVVVSFDWFDDELGPAKTDFSRSGRLKLVWEGQAGTLRSVITLREALNSLKDEVELHVVTDPSYPRWFGRWGTRTAAAQLAGFHCPVHFHGWDRQSFSADIIGADIAVLPMDMSHPIFRAKPENKLVLLWKLGMPVLAAPTRAYSRAMAGAGLDLICETPEQWIAQLSRLASSAPAVLADLGAKGRAYAGVRYGETAFREPYDAVFASLGYTVS